MRTDEASRSGIAMACAAPLHMWRAVLQLLFALLAIFAAPSAVANVQYIYDEAGRLVEVVAPSGESARYSYDAAGNIKSIRRAGVSTVAIGEFTPNQGAIGTAVAIYGSGFSTTAANNLVKFNGTASTVTSATSNRLLVTVPVGAGTGTVSVTVGGSTASSSESFTVLATVPGAPTISGFSPTSGTSGTAVTVSGTGFGSDVTKVRVTLNGRPVSISSVAPSQISLAITPEASSGRFAVTTPLGTAVSAGDFYVAPGGTTEASVFERLRLTVDGPALTSGSVPGGKVGLYLFEGTVGQALNLGVSPIALSGGATNLTVELFAPNGAVIKHCGTFGAGGDACVIPPLPQSGSYLLRARVAGTSGTGQYTFTLSREISASLMVDGTATTFSTTRAGQSARYTFSGVAGNSYSIVPGSVTLSPSTQISVIAPDGRTLASGTFAPSSSLPIDLPAVPFTGTYTVFVDPTGAATGQLALSVLADASGSVAVDGASLNASLRSGQNGRYSFSGIAGQNLSIGLDALTTTPAAGSVRLSVYSPSGLLLISCAYSNAQSCAFPALPGSGQYVIVADPVGMNSATFTLTLSSDLVGVLSPNAAPLTFAPTRPGQNGRYSFTAIAGMRYAVVPSNVTIPGTWTQVKVLGPDGAQIQYVNVGAGHPPMPLDLPVLPAGTYVVVVDPYQTATGQLSLSVRSDASGAITVDGPPVSVSLLDGQNTRLTFSGNTGQNLGIGLTSLQTSPANGGVKISVVSPSGAVFFTCLTGGGYFTGDGDCPVPALPASGIYALHVDPQASVSASLSLSLSSEVSAVLMPNATAATTFSTTRPGQNGRYFFDATMGDRLSVAVSNPTIVGTWTTLSVLRPDGVQIANGTTATSHAPPVIDIGPAPLTGRYAIVINPYMANVGQVSVRLVSEAGGAIAVDGPPVPMALSSGQNGRLTFSGTAGQRLGLGISAMSSTPSGGALSVKIQGPNGTDVVNCPTYSAASAVASCNVPALPATGTYTVLVDPNQSNAFSLTLTLSTDIAGILTVDGAAATSFVTARLGQNGRYTFAGVAGTNYRVVASDISIPGTWTYVHVYAPDGTLLGSNYGSSTTPLPDFNLANAPATGEYAVMVDPVAGGTGRVDLKVLKTGVTTPSAQTPNGTLTVDGAGLAISVPANQTHRYVFAGTLGQRLGLGGSGISVSPAGSAVTVSITRPDNTTALTSCSFFATGFGCNLPPLPSSGTYTVRVQPAPGATVTATLFLSNDVSGTLPGNGSVATVTTGRAGQNVRYAFAGTAGSSYAIAWSGSTYTPGSAAWITVYRPDGQQLAAAQLFGATGALDLANVPATGNYTVFVDPPAASTGQVSLALRQLATGSVAVDGASTAVSLAQGQDGRLTFTGAAGQSLGLAVTGLATVPANSPVLIRVLDPIGNLHTDCSSSSAPWSCTLKPILQAGSHALVVEPPAGASATLALTLSNDLVGTLAPNASSPTSFATTRPGQNGRYSFNGTPGQHLSLTWSGSSLHPSSTLYVLRPDGTTLTGVPVTVAAGSLDLPALALPGTYTVLVDPFAAATGAISLNLREAVAANLVVDGSPLNLSLLPGQQGRVSLTASANQQLGLAFTNVLTSPAAANVAAQVFGPDGSFITSCLGSPGAPWSCQFVASRGAGVYSVVVSLGSTPSASMTLTLSGHAQAVLSANAASPTMFSSARPGQDGWFTFSANAGDDHSITWTGATIPGHWSYLHAVRPDGSLQGSALFAAEAPRGILDLGPLPYTGTYAVHVDPLNVKTGSVSLALTKAHAATLTPDDPTPMPVALLTGQKAVLSFDAGAGANLGVILSNVVTAPADPSTNPLKVDLLDSAGQVLHSCTVGKTDNMSCRFPTLKQTGGYRVRIVPGTSSQPANSASFGVRLRSTL